MQYLFLWGNPVSGEGLEHLRSLKKLKQLDLGRTQITDRRLIGLRSLTGLERIDLPNNPQLTGSFLQYVAELPKLKGYVLRGTGITDSALAYLEHAKNVQSLMLDRTRVSDAFLPYLRGLTSLRSLDLSETAVTDVGIARVREWLPLVGVKPIVPKK